MPEESAPNDVDVDEGADYEDGDEPLPWYVVAAYVLLVAGGFALAVWYTVSWYARCDDGRHKSPYVAGDSLRGTLCDSGHGAAGLLVPGGWIIGLVLATIALARWGGGPARTVLLAVLFLTPVVLPPAAYSGLRHSGTSCTGDKLEAYGEWVDDGSKGTAPYDCRTF